VPLRKFRSVAEMPSAAWREPLDPRNLKLACELSALATRLRPRRFSPGLHKYRSVEEAARCRERWESRGGAEDGTAAARPGSAASRQ
jgi:hypothetical protein